MAYKPEIQYVGQFYVYGSEAQKVAQKRKAQFQLPRPQPVKIEKVYVDPYALVGLAVAAVMLICMFVGAVQISTSWVEYEEVSHYLAELKRENARLEHTLHTSYNIDEVAAKAEAMGLVPLDQIPSMSVRVTVPPVEPEMTRWDEFVWFMKGLFA